MAGIVSVCISVIGTVLDSRTIIIVGTLAVGIIFLHVAAYKAWQDEHNELVASKLPLFKGKINDFFCMEEKIPEDTVVLAFNLDFSNRGGGTSAIMKVTTLIPTIEGKVLSDAWEEAYYSEPNGARLDRSKMYARGQADRLRVVARIRGIDKTRINEKGVRVRITDAFGDDHIITP